jgi:putative transposase
MPRRFAFKHPSYFHVLNRAVRRDRLFFSPWDYEAFLRALAYAQAHVTMPILAYCVMPNHFHLVVGPTVTPILSSFMHRLTITHSKRWHVAHGSVGTGSVYQGRFKAVRIKDDAHFATVCRYVELNPVRAGLVEDVSEWRWSSVSRDRKNCDVTLSALPILR